MSKKKCKKCECPAGEKWAVPTADFFSLLLALFIALFAIASVNKEKIRAVKEEFVKIYDYAPVPEEINPVVDMVPENKTVPSATANPSGAVPVPDGGAILQASPPVETVDGSVISKIQQDMQEASSGEGPLDQSMDGVLLKLPTSLTFRGSNTTVEGEDSHLFLRRLADIINTLPPSVHISVRGHTDSLIPPKNSGFQDNLELSSRRAESVVRELIRNGVASNRIWAAGFGDTAPVAPNTTEANRVQNRRVDFYMFISKNTDLPPAKQQTILDSIGKLKNN